MARDPDDWGGLNSEDVDDQFYNDRLDRDYLTQSDWPARIDQAAIDLLYGISIGKSKQRGGGITGFTPGGTIGKFDFGRATGRFYKEGLEALSGGQSDLPGIIERYQNTDVGDLAFRFNELWHNLQMLEEGENQNEIQHLNRAIEAVVEKVITRSMHQGNVETRQSLENPETVVEMMLQVFSDPAAERYASILLDEMSSGVGGENLLGILDAPEMVTPLWDHQREAVQQWFKAGRKGYVNMATATGKTVLGLAAIAACYGRLHPFDNNRIERATEWSSSQSSRVLIVAGQDLLLEQWRSEFDEHLNIPRDRTEIGDDGVIKLQWGSIEFKTAQELLTAETLTGYDLVILDEAHQYRRGSRSGRGWRDVFESLASQSDAILAMSGSVDQGWIGDDKAQNALESHLTECCRFSVPEAREAGVIADFSWEIRYASAGATDALTNLTGTTQTLARAYNKRTHHFDLQLIDIKTKENEPTTFHTLTDLRSFAQSKAGSNTRDRSTAFDKLATASFSRRPQRWQLAPLPETVADLVTTHTPEQKVVVLVQSYKQAEEIGAAIRNKLGEQLVLVPDAEANSQFDIIQEYNEGDARVIVGPGDVLGTGVDMPEADVAINLSKGGVNASLIQRIGRVLRNPSGDKHARFYQIVTLPSDEEAILPGEDGRRILQRAAEFRALGARLRQLPGFTTTGAETDALVRTLERAGTESFRDDKRPLEKIVEDEVAQGCLEELMAAIEETDETESRTSVLVSRWNDATLEREIEPVKEAVEKVDGTKTEGSTGHSDASKTTNSVEEVAVGDDKRGDTQNETSDRTKMVEGLFNDSLSEQYKDNGGEKSENTTLEPVEGKENRTERNSLDDFKWVQDQADRTNSSSEVVEDSPEAGESDAPKQNAERADEAEEKPAGIIARLKSIIFS